MPIAKNTLFSFEIKVGRNWSLISPIMSQRALAIWFCIWNFFLYESNKSSLQRVWGSFLYLFCDKGIFRTPLTLAWCSYLKMLYHFQCWHLTNLSIICDKLSIIWLESGFWFLIWIKISGLINTHLAKVSNVSETLKISRSPSHDHFLWLKNSLHTSCDTSNSKFSLS